MTLRYSLAGLACLLMTGSANATTIFNSIISDYNNVALHSPIANTQGGSPDAQEFILASAMTLESLTSEAGQFNLRLRLRFNHGVFGG